MKATFQAKHPDWKAPDADSPLSLDKLEVKPEIDTDSVRTFATQWIEKFATAPVFADTDSDPTDRDLAAGPLSVANATRWIAREYLALLCEGAELPRIPAVALPIVLDSPDTTWAHVFHAFGVYLEMLSSL